MLAAISANEGARGITTSCDVARCRCARRSATICSTCVAGRVVSHPGGSGCGSPVPIAAGTVLGRCALPSRGAAHGGARPAVATPLSGDPGVFGLAGGSQSVSGCDCADCCRSPLDVEVRSDDTCDDEVRSDETCEVRSDETCDEPRSDETCEP